MSPVTVLPPQAGQQQGCGLFPSHSLFPSPLLYPKRRCPTFAPSYFPLHMIAKGRTYRLTDNNSKTSPSKIITIDRQVVSSL